MRVGILFLGVAAAIVSFAAAPVARVISAAPVNVDGILAPARNFVPLQLGAEVITEGASAVIQFTDGTAITLQPHSKLRVEGQASNPVGRVLRGSAIYDAARTPSSAPVNRATPPNSKVPPGVASPAPAAGWGNSNQTPVTGGFRYRGQALPQPGVIAPRAAAFTGSFSRGGAAAGVEAGPQILTPDGMTVNLTAVVNPTTGATTYVVSTIQQTVTTSSGSFAVVTVTSGPLIGATVTGISTPGASSTFTFTPVGSNTPLTPQQTATAVQNGVQQAINNGVTNGTLPAGTQPPTLSPVTNGQFSASGG
ncbi:MAG: hypothetical protein JWP63_4317 [Candidatus Solibacter sp.]|nr:hypothetical protein [Candidatus Solibacter sp.]